MTKSGLTAVLLLALTSTDATAQSCIGLPTDPGEFAPRAFVQVGSGPTSYGVDVVGNLVGPFLAGASFQIDDRTGNTDNGQTFGAVVGYELPLATSICLLLSPNYTLFDSDPPTAPPASVKILRLPILVGVGQRMQLTRDYYLVSAARGGFMHRRLDIDVEGDATDIEDSENEALVAAGVAVGRGPTFVNAEIMVTTEDQAETRFTFGLGYILP